MKNVTVLALAALGLSLGACKQSATEQRADRVEDRAEATADALENRADKMDPRMDGTDTPAEQKLDAEADRVREQGKEKADEIRASGAPGDKSTATPKP